LDKYQNVHETGSEILQYAISEDVNDEAINERLLNRINIHERKV